MPSFLTANRTAPAQSGVTVSPSDATNFKTSGETCRSIYVGTTGNVVVVFGDDSTVTFNSVPAGAILPVEAKRVNSTNTTASNMVALY